MNNRNLNNSKKEDGSNKIFLISCFLIIASLGLIAIFFFSSSHSFCSRGEAGGDGIFCDILVTGAMLLVVCYVIFVMAWKLLLAFPIVLTVGLMFLFAVLLKIIYFSKK